MAEIQTLSSQLEVQNAHLNSDLQKCERARAEAAAEAAKQLQLQQKTHDDEVVYICTLMCEYLGTKGEILETSWFSQSQNSGFVKFTVYDNLLLFSI